MTKTFEQERCEAEVETYGHELTDEQREAIEWIRGIQMEDIQGENQGVAV